MCRPEGWWDMHHYGLLLNTFGFPSPPTSCLGNLQDKLTACSSNENIAEQIFKNEGLSDIADFPSVFVCNDLE